MKETRTIETIKDGKKIVTTIEIIREVQDKTSNLDGDIVNLGRETVNTITIEVTVDGKFFNRSYRAPEILDPRFYRNYKQLVAVGAYARLGDKLISKQGYDNIMAVITEVNAIPNDEDYNQVDAEEIAKENAQIAADKVKAAQYASQIRNGLCPKCGTYCYGDCEAN